MQHPTPRPLTDLTSTGSSEASHSLAMMAQEIIEATMRAEFMASASATLASSLDYEQTLSSVAQLAVPRLADWCMVDVVNNDGHLVRVAVAHVDPAKVQLVHELSARYPEKPDLPFGVLHVLRTGKAEMASEITQEILKAAAHDEGHLAILRELGLTSYLCVPLLARGEAIGVISMVLADPTRRYTVRDLSFAEELATRSALAIENARLYRESRESADWLSTTLRSIGDAVIATDREGTVKFLNPVAEKLTGWLLADAAGRPLDEVFILRNELTGAPVSSPAKEAFITGRVAELERPTMLISKDGGRVAIDDSAAPIFDSRGQISGVVFVFRDVTAKREAERERAERSKLASFSAAVHMTLSEAESEEVMLRQCAGLVVEYLEAAFARIWILDEWENVLVLRASAGLYTHLDGPHGRIPVGSFKIGRIAQERKPNLTNQVLDDPNMPEQDWARREGLVAFAGYPLLIDGNLLGVIGMFARRELSEMTLQALQTVSHAFALGIQRKRAEAELREQSEWFSVTLGSIGDAVITVDTQGRITFLNAVAERLTGWSTAAAVGRPMGEVLQIVDETTRQPAKNPIDRALAEGVIVALANHTTLIARDGTEIPIEDSAAPIRNPAGEIIGAVMVFHDVTDRREKEIALERSQERFRLLGEVVPQILWTTDPTGSVEYFNERWYAYTGKRSPESEAWGWSDVLHPDDCERTLQAWKGSTLTGEPYDIEYRLRRYDGEYRWFVGRSVPLRDEAGLITRWYGSCTDIHQQKLTAEALREEYTVTEHLHEVAKALATELDLSKVVQFITDAGTRLIRAQFGAFFYNLIDESGETFMLYTLSGVPREVFEKFPMPRATGLFGPTFRGEGVIRSGDIRKDSRFGKNPPYHGMPAGHLPVVSYLAVSVVSRSGEVIGGLFFGHAQPDVFTERDEKIIVGLAALAASAMDTAGIYQREQQARAQAEHASRAKDHFLAALSHELRTPLTPVLAILSSLRHDTELPAALAEDLETVRRNVELEARLIDDLLDLTRITSGKLELYCERVTVGTVIEAALDTCLSDFEAKQLVVVREISGAAQEILADSARITQILWNLLKNAAKFTPKGGTITVRSRVERGGGGGKVWIEIQDTGIGIGPDRVGHIFDAFEQGDRKITRQFGGLGLGLAISKAIAELHDGTLTASSEGVGRGATFGLMLPFDGCDEAEENALELQREARRRASAPVNLEGPQRLIRILLVEDHADTAAILLRLLRRMGHEVIHAGTVEAALQTAEKEMSSVGIDLVVSDLGLPDGSGLDLMRELSRRYGLRGIALSGFGMESDLEQSTAAGFSRHLVKPIDINIVRAAIAEMAQGSSDSK